MKREVVIDGVRYVPEAEVHEAQETLLRERAVSYIVGNRPAWTWPAEIERIRREHNGVFGVRLFFGHDGHNACEFWNYEAQAEKRVLARGESGRSMQEAAERCIADWRAKREPCTLCTCGNRHSAGEEPCSDRPGPPLPDAQVFVDYQNGKTKRAQGGGREENPYPAGTSGHAAWLRGWEDEDVVVKQEYGVPTVESVYGKPLEQLTPPEGWEFTGEFRQIQPYECIVSTWLIPNDLPTDPGTPPMWRLLLRRRPTWKPDPRRWAFEEVGVRHAGELVKAGEWTAYFDVNGLNNTALNILDWQAGGDITILRLVERPE